MIRKENGADTVKGIVHIRPSGKRFSGFRFPGLAVISHQSCPRESGPGQGQAVSVTFRKRPAFSAR